MLVGPTIGLLPLYLRLYDDIAPERRAVFGLFLRHVHEVLLDAGAGGVVNAEVCREADEVGAAVRCFERNGVDCIVTLHLAYSPSLEAVPALRDTRLPLILLDTTMDADFGPDTIPDAIMNNHGVHGVMDLASVLRREGRYFEIAAGHLSDGQLAERVVDLARGAAASCRFRDTRALRIGPTFPGMGDFAVAESVLENGLGIRVDEVGVGALRDHEGAVRDAEVRAEMEADESRFAVEAPREVHRRSVRTGLALRRMLDARYEAFSANFLAFDDPVGPVMPFLEIGKALSRGVGYAGEGDVLTASLVGALGTCFGQATFTEVFCADWRGNSLFLSHMGEANPDLAPERPRLIEGTFPFIKSGPSAMIACGIRPGAGTYVNLAPGPGGSFTVIVVPVEILEDTRNEEMRRKVRAWVRPALPVADFLERYSRLGGTHHSALLLGERTAGVSAFARFAGLGCAVL